MGEQQWCLRVERDGAETIRRALLEDGILDRDLKIRADGEFLLFPVIQEMPDSFRAEFELLRKRIELPRHEQVGGIVILQEEDCNGAATILRERPAVHTALFAESGVSGEFRTKKFRVLAGENTTETLVTEYGHRFKVDLEKAYFSARLASERQRILAMMQEGEEVCDMFAGVGPFAIVLAAKAGRVWACDLNPEAVSLMIENISLNRVRNVIPVLGNAGSLPGVLSGRFDRIIMNLPLIAWTFLDAACSLCRPGGVIHCYMLMSEEDGEPDVSRLPVASLQKRFVRSYAPGKSHMVYDMIVR